MAQYVSNNLAGGTLCLTKATMAAGTTTTLSNTGTVTFAIKGFIYTKAAMTNAATPTTDATTGVAFLPVTTSTGCLFVISYNSSGAVGVSQGPITSSTTDGYQCPAVPTTYAPIAVLKIVAGSTASAAGWVFGTNNNSSVTGITYTFYDLFAMPVAPLA